MELKHFADKHPLAFKEDAKELSKDILCDGCNERVLGSCYSCRDCDFDLHKSCAELPRELHHPIHPKHPLILFEKPPYDEKTCTCNGCNQKSKLFVYHCSLCRFDLDIKCALLPLTNNTEVHEHLLTLVRSLVSFTCDVCGQESKGMVYLCAICPFLVHVRCASLPHTVKHIRHKHPLNLTYSLRVDKYDHQLCQLCVKKMNIDYGVYFCSSCNFVAHLNCATDKDLQDKMPNESSVTRGSEDAKINEYANSITCAIKKLEVGGGENELKHFIHEHELALTSKFDDSKKCDGCMRSIFTPFYSCDQCDFYLHKSCAELPRTKQHPLHQHTLTLLPKVTFGVFLCNACYCYCSGFMYECDECKFCLDVQCSSISISLTHGGHKHPLVLSNECGNCNACGHYKENILRCASCEDFTLHFGCATLPHSVRYKRFDDPFILTYHTIDDGSDEYYCDICEEPRDPKHWFYHCVDGDYSAHLKCVLGEYPYIKFGRTYTSDAHQHPVTLVQKTKDYHPCDKCGRHTALFLFECTQCNFVIDRRCL